MVCSNAKRAVITASLAAGSTASPYQYSVDIEQRLCHAVCVDNVPVFAPALSLVNVTPVSATVYSVVVNVSGTISYTPCGCQCNGKVMPINQNFEFKITSASAPTVTIAGGVAANSLAPAPCCDCTRNFVSSIPMTVTVATA